MMIPQHLQQDSLKETQPSPWLSLLALGRTSYGSQRILTQNSLLVPLEEQADSDSSTVRGVSSNPCSSDLTRFLLVPGWYSIPSAVGFLGSQELFADGAWLSGSPRIWIKTSVCNDHWEQWLFQLWFPEGICPVVGLLDHRFVLFLVF